jgi:hypothetical protein
MAKQQARRCDLCGYIYTTDAHSWGRASTVRILDEEGKTVDEKAVDVRHKGCGGFMVVPATKLGGL